LYIEHFAILWEVKKLDALKFKYSKEYSGGFRRGDRAESVSP